MASKASCGQVRRLQDSEAWQWGGMWANCGIIFGFRQLHIPTALRLQKHYISVKSEHESQNEITTWNSWPRLGRIVGCHCFTRLDSSMHHWSEDSVLACRLYNSMHRWSEDSVLAYSLYSSMHRWSGDSVLACRLYSSMHHWSGDSVLACRLYSSMHRWSGDSALAYRLYSSRYLGTRAP